MKAPRILVLGVAFVAGGAAACLVGNDEEKSNPPIIPIATADAPIARRDLGIATALSAQPLQRQAWRSAITSGRDIRRDT